ncbi:MAG: hypothetical protein ACOY4R_05710 [Pseudomonadota bacterium]
MWYVFEAEFEVESDPGIPPAQRKVLWDKPIKETIAWHGPFDDQKEASKAASGRAWAKIDKCYHAVQIVEVNMPMARK